MSRNQLICSLVSHTELQKCRIIPEKRGTVCWISKPHPIEHRNGLIKRREPGRSKLMEFGQKNSGQICKKNETKFFLN